MFANFIGRYSGDNFVLTCMKCQFYDTGGKLQLSVTHAKETNRFLRGRFPHPDLHCLQSSLSQYDAAWVKFIFEILQT